MDALATARLNGIGRAVLGASMVVAPGSAARLWLGSPGGIESKVLGRTHGARDLALGAGLVWALERDEPVHPWITAAAISDVVDAGVTLAFWNGLSRAGRWVVLGMAAGSAIQMGTLAARTAR
jgi:hypothetical protein